MKKQISLVLTVVFIFLVGAAFAQKDKSKRPSPPAKAEGTIDGVKVVIDYSSPSVKGRKIFGDHEPYGQVWRTGANEPTSIEFDKNVKIEGKDLAKGKYAIYSIPGEKEWTIIINKKYQGWGTEYDQTQDVFRVNVKPAKTDKLVEQLNFAIQGNNVVISWENTKVAFNVKG